MAVGDLLELKVIGNLHGQLIVNVLHYIVSIDPAIDPALSLATQFDAVAIGPWLNAASLEYNYARVEARRLLPLPVQDPVIVSTGAAPGSDANDSLPASVAATITKRSGIAGRANRGRVFFAGVPINAAVQSQLIGGYLATLQAVATELEEPFLGDAGAILPCIFHRALGTIILITSCLARSVLRNQRRRQWGKGS